MIYLAFLALSIAQAHCAIKFKAEPTWQTEIQWILETQRQNGAWPITKGGDWIAPYVTNIALTNVLRLNTSPTVTAQVKRWLQWYIGHLNSHTTAEGYNMDGTLYDWEISPTGIEKLKYDKDNKPLHDSTDSYAATFLTLVKKYYEATGDRTFILQQMPNLRRISHAILRTFNENLWLTYAKPGWDHYYLMDNVEVWRGWLDYSELLADMLDADESFWWLRKAEAVRAGIESRLYDRSKGYYMYYYNSTQNPTDFNIYYADAVANIYTQVYKLPEGIEPNRRESIYNRFRYGKPMTRWINRIYVRGAAEGNDFPDAYVSEAAKINGDICNINKWRNNVFRLWFDHREYTYTIVDASYLALRLFDTPKMLC